MYIWRIVYIFYVDVIPLIINDGNALRKFMAVINPHTSAILLSEGEETVLYFSFLFFKFRGF